MWLWQQRKLLKKRIFLSKLFLISSILHLIFLLVLFFVYNDSFLSYHIEINKALLNPDVQIIVLPLHKVAPKSVSCAQMSNQVKASPQGPSKHTVMHEVKKQQTTLTQKEPVQPKKQQLQQPKTVQPKKDKPEKLPAKKVAQTAPKKSESNKTKQEKATKAITKKNNKQPLKQNEKQGVLAQKQNRTQQKPVQAEDKQIVYVGSQELEALQMHDAVQKEVVHHWKPPVGLSKELVCQIKMLINWEGNLETITVAQSSGVLLYDIAARSAVQKVSLPKWAWGKEFAITFKQ